MSSRCMVQSSNKIATAIAAKRPLLSLFSVTRKMSCSDSTRTKLFSTRLSSTQGVSTVEKRFPFQSLSLVSLSSRSYLSFYGSKPLLLRYFSRSSLDGPPTATDKAVTFVITVGYPPEVARGVVQAMKDSGITSPEALLSAVKSLAGRWEVGEDEGLEALAASVKQQLQAQQDTPIVTIRIVPGSAWESGDPVQDGDYDPHETNSDNRLHQDNQYHVVPTFRTSDASQQQRAFTVQAYEGSTLTDVAKFGSLPGASILGEYLECACAGIMACSTCHVVVDGDWADKVGHASEDEQDMIDLAYGPRESSRLGCQIVLTKELDGLVLWLPKGHNNLMDHIPFEG